MKYLIFLVLIVLIGVVYKKIADTYFFVCPKCENKFQASAYSLIFTMHFSNKHYLKCPKCGKKAFMRQTIN